MKRSLRFAAMLLVLACFTLVATGCHTAGGGYGPGGYGPGGYAPGGLPVMPYGGGGG